MATTKVTSAGIADNATTLAKMAGGTDGNLITYDASGDPAYVTTGTSGQILTSGGTGVAPTFQTAAGGGKVLQVVQSTDNSKATTTSSTLVDSGLSAAITPSATSSKVLCFLSCPMAETGGGSTDSGTIMGLIRTTTELSRVLQYTNGSSATYTTATINYLDSPSTTSATTYKAQFAAYGGGTAEFPTGNSNQYTATLILMEIGA